MQTRGRRSGSGTSHSP